MIFLNVFISLLSSHCPFRKLFNSPFLLDIHSFPILLSLFFAHRFGLFIKRNFFFCFTGSIPASRPHTHRITTYELCPNTMFAHKTSYSLSFTKIYLSHLLKSKINWMSFLFVLQILCFWMFCCCCCRLSFYAIFIIFRK